MNGGKMLYRDLYKIFGYDPLYKEEEGIKILREQYGISAPYCVFQEIYCGLSNDPEFQRLYGHIEIDKLEWRLIALKNDDFITLGRNATYPCHMLEVSEDYPLYKNGNEFPIDLREDVAAHWRKYGTWKEPPMLIERSLICPNESGLHLMEGHTRVGTLLGAIKYGFVSLAETHQVYLASIK